jgi:hypothetical protein
MTMELNTAEKFLLIILHPEKSGYLVNDTLLNPGLFGAILFDLSLEGKIEIIDKRIVAHSGFTKLSEVHNKVLGKIAAAKKRKKVKTWIAGFTWNGRKFRHMMLHTMAMKGLVRLEDKRFLIFPYKSARLLNKNARKSLLENLRDIILKNKQPDNETASILGLVQACKMQKIISKDKAELKSVKSNLKTLVNQDSISGEVQQVIKEIQIAFVTSVVTRGG